MAEEGLERALFSQAFPGAATLFEHSDMNVREGKTLKRPNGQVSSVFSITVSEPQLNLGRPTLIPTIYDGKEVSQQEAIRRAIKSKKTFPKFQTFEQADGIAGEISKIMGAGG